MALWKAACKAEANLFKELLGYGLKQTPPRTQLFSRKKKIYQFWNL